jgi:hypothetical protein
MGKKYDLCDEYSGTYEKAEVDT